MIRVKSHRRRTVKGKVAIVREHEREGDPQSRQDADTATAAGLAVKRRSGRQVKAQRPAHPRRTIKSPPEAKAPASKVKVSLMRDIFGNTPNPYKYSNAVKAYFWDKGYNNWVLSELGSELNTKSFNETIKLFNILSSSADTAGEAHNYWALGKRLAEIVKEYKKEHGDFFKIIQEGFVQRIADKRWQEINRKQVEEATKRLQRKVTTNGSLTRRALNKIVNSPAFIKWFGDWRARSGKVSHVVDEQRKPKEQREIIVPAIVYHGTPQKKGFTYFTPEKGKTGNLFGPGFYFTSDYDVAKGYAQDYSKLAREEKPRGKAINDAVEIRIIAAELARRLARARKENKITVREMNYYADAISDFHNKKDDDYGNVERLFSRATPSIKDALDLDNYLTLRGHKPYQGAIYTAFLNIINPYNLDVEVSNGEIEEILALGKEVGGEYSAFHLKHLWDEVSEEGQVQIANWLIKTGRAKRKNVRPKDAPEGYLDLEGEGLTDAVAVRKIWEVLNKHYGGDYDYKTKKTIKAPLHQFKPGGKSGVLTRQMLFRMLADWGWSDRGATLYTSYIKSKGYDGITHTGGWNIGTKDHKVWIAFEPEQVKSTLNEGTFNPDDPDMFKGICHARRTAKRHRAVR